jgi:hypothetical protein
MVLPSTESISDGAPVAPSPDAVAELTRSDGCVLVLGEHLGRLRDLAEGLLRVGCRVEIAARARVDRIGRRASIRGRQLALRPVDFRLLRALVEHARHGCSLDELRAAALTRARVEDQRALADVRNALEHLRSVFRRTDVRLVSTPDERYRLTTRLDRL